MRLSPRWGFEGVAFCDRGRRGSTASAERRKSRKRRAAKVGLFFTQADGWKRRPPASPSANTGADGSVRAPRHPSQNKAGTRKDMRRFDEGRQGAVELRTEDPQRQLMGTSSVAKKGAVPLSGRGEQGRALIVNVGLPPFRRLSGRRPICNLTLQGLANGG